MCEQRRSVTKRQEINILITIERRKANWIVHILRRKCLLKHVIERKTEGRIEVTEKSGRRHKQLQGDLREKERVLEIARGSTGSRCVENWLWKGLWNCCKADGGMNGFYIL